MTLAEDRATVSNIRQAGWLLNKFLQQTPLQMKEGIVRQVRGVTDLLETLDEANAYAPPGLHDAAKAALRAAKAFRDAPEDRLSAADLQALADKVRTACVPLLANMHVEGDKFTRWSHAIRDELDRQYAATLPPSTGVDLNRLPGDYVDPVTVARRKKEAFNALSDEDKERIRNDPEAFERWERHGTLKPPVENKGRARVLAAKYPALDKRR